MKLFIHSVNLVTPKGKHFNQKHIKNKSNCIIKEIKVGHGETKKSTYLNNFVLPGYPANSGIVVSAQILMLHLGHLQGSVARQCLQTNQKPFIFPPGSRDNISCCRILLVHFIIGLAGIPGQHHVVHHTSCHDNGFHLGRQLLHGREHAPEPGKNNQMFGHLIISDIQLSRH